MESTITEPLESQALPSDECIALVWRIVDGLEQSGEDLRTVTLERMKALLTEELRARLTFRGE